ncbi:hypothetical protein M5K25_020454 [Dendrobium thyrsiflorum]|uniref:Uncharacterized protein n=1 Tax=Dendrobium thyrsiflorum TaxID=117978 RepID=A0ABD0UA40_DENTH
MEVTVDDSIVARVSAELKKLDDEWPDIGAGGKSKTPELGCITGGSGGGGVLSSESMLSSQFDISDGL